MLDCEIYDRPSFSAEPAGSVFSLKLGHSIFASRLDGPARLMAGRRRCTSDHGRKRR